MLYLIPAPLHRAALRVGYRLRKMWWRVARPQITGVAVIARDGDGRVLLVRHSYGSGVWTFPGGGLRKNEDPAAGAAREFAEELGCAPGPLTFLGELEGTLHGVPSHTHMFTCTLAGTPRPDRREIAEARFFAVDALPEGRGSRVATGLEMLEQR